MFEVKRPIKLPRFPFWIPSTLVQTLTWCWGTPGSLTE